MFAILFMPPGENCIIDIVGVFIRSKLSYANKRQKETLKNTFLTLVGPQFKWFLQVFYAHCPSKPLNAGEQEKPQQLPPVQAKCNFLKANKLNTNPPKATFYCKLQCFMHLRTYEKMPPRSAWPPPPPPFPFGNTSKRYSAFRHHHGELFSLP